MGLPKISAALVCALWFVMVHSCHAQDYNQDPASQDYGHSDSQDSTPQDYGHSDSQDSGSQDYTQNGQQDSAPQDTPQYAPPTAPHYSTPQEWVDAHNAIRKPEGVVLMTWNQSLAQYAQNYLKKIAPNCNMEHSDGPYGECLFQGGGDATAKEIVDYWASEKKYYDFKTKKCAEEQVCWHYLQVVNPNSPGVGCAKAKCANDPFYWIDICSYTW